MKYKEQPDLYEGDDIARFILGKKGKRPLVVFGINPSNANKQQSDRTINRVIQLSQQHGFDGWIMLNLYPQRNKDPKKLHKVCDQRLHEENIHFISLILSDYPEAVLCAAWGNNIENHQFLRQCLRDIQALTDKSHFVWKSIGPLGKKEHPKHPLYLPSSLPLIGFDIEKSLR